MSAQAGPGPSTMASSPIVPNSAKKLRVRKRVINLVNPADPDDFSISGQSFSPTSSPDHSRHDEEKENSCDPLPTVHLTEVTQTFNYTPGSSAVRGILRPTGTPGSGNGVRFFPKNKFRIITPNASLIAPSPQPKVKPPSSPTNSFFSQLLAVTIPSMSPLRGVPAPEPEPEVEQRPDESWEVPGQEGEISLVASTASVDHDQTMEESILEDSWNGQPEQHCSPLTLPSVSEGNTSKDISFQALELPSEEWNLPEDMSNLLSTRLNEESSFSLTDPPSHALAPIVETSAENRFWGVQDQSTVSENQSELDDNPTIRRHLSPSAPSMRPIESETPTPAASARPMPSSIFADMSAEQADLTWPLTRRDTDDDDLGSESAMGDSPLKIGMGTPKATSPAVGDTTEFFDCTAMILSPSDSSVVLRSSPIHKGLVVPTQALFEAQAAHTSALSAELELYRALTQKLHAEVAERDNVLAKLNLRALEAEVLQSQVSDLRDELAALRSTSRQKSISPSPSPTLRAERAESFSDRTMAAQSEAKDLEIRLAKALADEGMMSRRLAEVDAAKTQQARELAETKAALRKLEEAERDRIVKSELEAKDNRLEILQSELESAQIHTQDLAEAQDEIHALKAELNAAHRQLNEMDVDALREDLDDAHRQIDQLETEVEGNAALREQLEEAHQQIRELEARSQEEDLNAELEDAHRRIDELQAEVDHHASLREELDDAHRHIDDLEAQVEQRAQLRAELEHAHRQIEQLQAQTPHEDLQEARDEIARLSIHIEELKEVKMADEEEMDRLLNEVDRLKASSSARGRKDEDLRVKLVEMERALEREILAREEVERRLEGEKQDRNRVEGKLRQSMSLADTQSLEPLNKEINRLRAESASKDLEILNLQRRKAELKDDREMLNIALDSKQQELELMKRRFSVKGIAGSTPLPLGTSQRTNVETPLSSATPATTKTMGGGMTTRRRSSVILQTPVPGNKHGLALHPSTRITNRVMSKVTEENKPPAVGTGTGGSVRRREREMMLA